MTPTSDRFDVQADADRVYDVLRSGGVAIVPYDLSYAIQCAGDDALRRVYAAKNRSYDRASGVCGSYVVHEAVHVMSETGRRIVRSITQDHDLPLSVVAPFREDHPFMKALTPFLFGMATRDGTVNFLLNGGELRDRIVAHAWRDNFPFVGSSANRSLAGTKYRVEDIEQEVRDAADIIIDYGTSRWEHPNGLSSTQIDFRTMKVIRWGLAFDRIRDIIIDEFGIELESRPAHLVA
ncbi:Sua5/YciO/YrdC/YwlC family protein [Bradyrhizobium sp. Ai1a-2]|uniref:L-threonylcarbamoyladenylate synthase n=1 Tax=Bradyrhizobium sp. Ai1a-2 TaxID=196490 RepID=UPI0005BC2A25|nr:Sua5/YciO/YrdC/YwlC family protein [Bradyrhizobium sp. Ai1a-2]